MRPSRLLWMVALLAPAPAFADVVVLSNGQEITGVVTESGDQIDVRVDAGTVSFARSDVSEIRRGDTKLHELGVRRAKLDASDAAGRTALARWAEQQGLADSAHELYREVIALRPDDATARERLGFKRHDGRWMNEEEHLLATGYVRYGGRWVTKDEAAILEKDAAERRRVQALESQVALQKKQIDQLEAKAETASKKTTEDGYDGYGYDGFGLNGWWLPHHPAFTYGGLRSHGSHGGRRSHGQSSPVPNLRGQLQRAPQSIPLSPALRR